MNEVRKINKLLIDDYPIQVLPKLAKKIGLNEAIFLQQIECWIKDRNENIIDNNWLFKTLEEMTLFFDFWSLSTLRRIINSLKKQNIILVEKRMTNEFDRTNCYSINYKILKEVLR